MDKIVRREFTGSWLLFWFLSVTGIGIPIAVIYLINNTVEIHSRFKDGESAMDKIRTKL